MCEGQDGDAEHNLCNQKGKAVARVVRCGAWLYITAGVPNSQCYEVKMTVMDEVCT